ncbi:MAG: hypothetical protein LBM98_10345 [Oscillospiraceae bacterium]|nr:hypothetical protein [Oscillospiraceae bacterium]
MRYVPLRPARQSSAGSVTYVCFPPGTGLLRTCNVLRIAHLPVLRNDGRGKPAPAQPVTSPQGATPSKPSKAPLFRGGCARRRGGCPAPCAVSDI